MMRVLGPLLMIAAAPLPTISAEPPLRVTTDSSAYCVELVARFAVQAASVSDPSTRQLAEEGARLCETGHTRTGIAKLRRALRATHLGG